MTGPIQNARDAIPKEINILGILYRVAVAEGCVVFSVAIPMWGCNSRIMFDGSGDCWRMQILDPFDKHSVSRIVKMYSHVVEWFGEDFGIEVPE